jgi:hypothetical protein
MVERDGLVLADTDQGSKALIWSWAIDCNGTPAASFKLSGNFGGLILYRVAYILIYVFLQNSIACVE